MHLVVRFIKWVTLINYFHFGGIVEFTKILKFGAAIIALVLIGKGTITGFDFLATIISVALLVIVYKMDKELLLSERAKSEDRILEIVTKYELQVKQLSDSQLSIKDELQKKIENTDSKISSLKLSTGMVQRK